jgi:hypothetical protein
VRGSILGLVLAVSAVGCTWHPDIATPAADGVEPVTVAPTPQEYDRVTAGAVEALIPPGWRAVASDPTSRTQRGFVASPRPQAWAGFRRGTTGLSATWIDATEVGVPSDYYYLAATGPVLSRLVASERCRRLGERVFANNVPAFASGDRRSPGDFVARGEGVCSSPAGATTRWAYFVAAPGLGPAREVGIPSSGLYVVVAAAPAGPDASELLDHLLHHTWFADASMGDFIRAVRALPVD